MPTNVKNISKEPVQFEKHDPERRRAGAGRLFCNGGCCCCSCCLHSLGGLIGAAVATSKSRLPSDGSVLGCYWISLLLLMMGLAVAVWSNGESAASLTVLMAAPLMQLVASFVTLVWIRGANTDPETKKTQMQTLGKITLWSFLWALAGLVLMILGVLMLMGH